MRDNTLNALGAALSASAAYAFLIAAALVCSFLEIRSRSGEVLRTVDEETTQTSSHLGILCPGDDLYDLSDEPMQKLSWAFVAGACLTGASCCLLAWAVLFGYSKPFFWQLISGLAAVSSLLQLPIFLLFEMGVCTDYTEDQECYLDVGSYLLIASTCCWVLTTLVTQCWDPPGFVLQNSPTKSSHIIPDVVIEHMRPRPHSETQRSRSSESQRSRLSQQNVSSRAQSIPTSTVQPSLISRSVVDWDRAHSLIDQTEMSDPISPSNVSIYPAGATTREFSQLSFASPNHAAQYFAHHSTPPPPERVPFPTVEQSEPSQSAFSDSTSHATNRRSTVSSTGHPLRNVSSRDVDSVDTGLSSLEELIAQAVRKNTRSRQPDGFKLEHTRSASPLSLGSLDASEDDEFVVNPITSESLEPENPVPRYKAKEPVENTMDEETRDSSFRSNDIVGIERISSSNRSWNPTGMKHMRIHGDSELRSPPLEISINMEESDDFLLDPAGAEELHGQTHVITPDAQDLRTMAGRSASFGGERYNVTSHAWQKSASSVKSDGDGWLAQMSAVHKEHAASSASIVSTSSARLGARAQDRTVKDKTALIERNVFDPYASQGTRQRSLSTPNFYEGSSFYATHEFKVSIHGNANHKDFPLSELNKPPLMRANLAPGLARDSSVLPREGRNEVFPLMSEEFLGHRVVSQTHIRSRSMPRGAFEKTAYPLHKDTQSLSEISYTFVNDKPSSIFRQDRDRRAGIHAPAVITNSAEDDDGSLIPSKSLLARKAREARLQRLSTARNPARRVVDDKHDLSLNGQIAERARQARAQRLMATRSTPSPLRSRYS
ncbi:hypothetical protein FisN_31Lh091 [Fistulifera solaris]|uniref:Uncharacterized protein n=1 Tax=Fistulifera solaris TaxID=1519565 RepID=A0A1Z5K6T0_FISSO|nr:hypothetical protein FisN_31Lh091 [Fistulifera solaris]|eukprot:GAX21801.1 hypothetical protein FisN_31Lh091 [Fistulifera solaris]